MDGHFETDDMPSALRLAAIVTLLSASALRAHLGAALADAALPGELRDAIEQALAGWRAVECHPASVSVPLCPLTVPGQSLH
ncbi:MAG: hypothetical protein MK097_14875 [Dechloromonas sp.]|nr:hypothetical protein [Dechloromonas sp.]